MERIENVMKEGRFHFAINCLNKLMEINPNKNFFFSPLCLYEELFTIYLMVTGEIEERLKQILFSEDISKLDLINYGRFKISSPVRDEDFAYFHGRNVICWINHNIRLDDRLLYFLDPPQHFVINSEDKIKLANVLLWSKVKDYIKVPVGLPVVKNQQHDIEFTLMTSICGKYQSSAAHSTDAPSTIANDNEIISYFHHELEMHVSEKLYEKGDMSLFIFVPAYLSSRSGEWKIEWGINRFTDLVMRLSTSEGMNKLRNLLIDGRTTKLKTIASYNYFRNFNVEHYLKIRELLQILGVQQLLTFDRINLDGLDPAEKQHLIVSVRMGNVVHQSNIKVTKKEVVAGAMTLIHTAQEPSPNIDEVAQNGDNPLIWLIYDKPKREILFSCRSF